MGLKSRSKRSSGSKGVMRLLSPGAYGARTSSIRPQPGHVLQQSFPLAFVCACVEIFWGLRGPHPLHLSLLCSTYTTSLRSTVVRTSLPLHQNYLEQNTVRCGMLPGSLRRQCHSPLRDTCFLAAFVISTAIGNCRERHYSVHHMAAH